MMCRDYYLEGLRRQAVVCAVGTGQPKMLVLSLPRLLPDHSISINNQGVGFDSTTN